MGNTSNYDSQVWADTLRTPGLWAGIIRCAWDRQAAGFHLECDTALMVFCQSVFEGGNRRGRNLPHLCAVGAKPLAKDRQPEIFGNPEKPQIMGQFVARSKASGAAVRGSG